MHTHTHTYTHNTCIYIYIYIHKHTTLRESSKTRRHRFSKGLFTVTAYDMYWTVTTAKKL